jgi:hypothetical protein
MSGAEAFPTAENVMQAENAYTYLCTMIIKLYRIDQFSSCAPPRVNHSRLEIHYFEQVLAATTTASVSAGRRTYM